MIHRHTLQDIIRPLEKAFPKYNLQTSLLDVALETRAANCAVRAYASGLLIRAAYPDTDQVQIQFGFDIKHGEDRVGLTGVRPLIGHTLLKVVDKQASKTAYPMIIESYNNNESMVVQRPADMKRFEYHTLPSGYQLWLDQLGYDVSVDPVHDLEKINTVLENWHSPLASAK